jgi:hypothetical protein
MTRVTRDAGVTRDCPYAPNQVPGAVDPAWQDGAR